MNPDLSLASLTSVGSVVTLTLFLIGVLKPSIATTAYLSRVPLWLYTVALSIGLTFLANRVYQTLPGDFGQLAMQGLVSALVAMGSRAVGRNATKPASESAPSPQDDDDDRDQPPTAGPGAMLVLACALVATSVGGCAFNGGGVPATPETQVARQRQTFTLVMRAVNLGIRRGDIPLEQARAFAPYVKAVEKALDEADAIAAELKALREAGKTDPAVEDAYLQATRILNAAMKSLEDETPAAADRYGPPAEPNTPEPEDADERTELEPAGPAPARGPARGPGVATGGGGARDRQRLHLAPALARAA